MKGSIQNRGKNTWRIRYELPRDPITGKRRQGSETVYGTKRDAEKRLREILTQLDQGTYTQPTKIPLQEYLLQWLQTHSANIRPTTRDRYEGLIRNHIAPVLGHITLDQLTPFHIQSLYNSKLTGGRADGKEGGLSGSSIRYLHSLLNQALKRAVKMRLIPVNPAEDVEVPSQNSNRNSDDEEDLKEQHPLTEEQVAKFLAAAKGNRFETLFILALGTGMRKGEMLALKWEDVDLKSGLVSIRRTLYYKRGEGLKFGPPKTQKSRRTISISPTVIEALRKHKIEQSKHKLRLGPLYHDMGLVFPNYEGKPFDPNKLWRYFKPILEKAGLPDNIRIHDLRHTHATLLIKRREDIKMVSERLGHSDVAFTIRVYHHVLPKVEQEAIWRFDEVLKIQEGGQEEKENCGSVTKR